MSFPMIYLALIYYACLTLATPPRLQKLGFLFPDENLEAANRPTRNISFVTDVNNNSINDDDEHNNDNSTKPSRLKFVSTRSSQGITDMDMVSNNDESLCPNLHEGESFCEDPVEYPVALVNKILSQLDNVVHSHRKMFFGGKDKKKKVPTTPVGPNQIAKDNDTEKEVLPFFVKPKDVKPESRLPKPKVSGNRKVIYALDFDKVIVEGKGDKSEKEDSSEEFKDDEEEGDDDESGEDVIGRVSIHDTFWPSPGFRLSQPNFVPFHLTTKPSETTTAATIITRPNTFTTTTTATTTTRTPEPVDEGEGSLFSLIPDKEEEESFLQESPLCRSESTYIYPKRAQNADLEYKFIINLPEKNYIQAVRVEKCLAPGGSCSLHTGITFADFGIKTVCRQKYAYRRLLAVNQEGEDEVDLFKFPSCCICNQITEGPFMSGEPVHLSHPIKRRRSSDENKSSNSSNSPKMEKGVRTRESNLLNRRKQISQIKEISNFEAKY